MRRKYRHNYVRIETEHDEMRAAWLVSYPFRCTKCGKEIRTTNGHYPDFEKSRCLGDKK